MRGVEVVDIADAHRLRFEHRLYWYRGLACWAKRDSDVGDDTSRMRKACRDFERAHDWTAVVRKSLPPNSDADWIQLGDGVSPVEVGLFVREAPSVQ